MSFRCRLYIPPFDSALRPAPGGWKGDAGEGRVETERGKEGRGGR